MQPDHTEIQESPVRLLLKRGQLFLEKCELSLAKTTLLEVVTLARKDEDREAEVEAVAMLLRLSAEARDDADIRFWDAELEKTMSGVSGRALALAWHNRSVVATHGFEFRKAQTFLVKAMKAFKSEFGIKGGRGRIERLKVSLSRDDLRLYVKMWASTAATLMDRRLNHRMEIVADYMIHALEDHGFHSEMTTLFIVKGVGAERRREYEIARRWYQKSHSAVLAARNWYFHLYVLYAYARVERCVRNFAQAYWYLDLIAQAASGPEYGTLQEIVRSERRRLEDDAVDLLVDARQCEIRTREKAGLSLGKQYVLIGILEALTDAHHRDGPDNERGLSKGEIIRKVWNEEYRPESHDNKLYYNINRLRKLIEPDVRHPKYLLNWKEGYRLAPGLRVQFVGGETDTKTKVHPAAYSDNGESK